MSRKKLNGLSILILLVTTMVNSVLGQKLSQGDTAKITSLIRLAHSQSVIDSTLARHYATQALDMAVRAPAPYLTKALIVNGDVLNQQGKYRKARIFFKRALQHQPDDRDRIEVLEGISFSFMRQSQFDSTKYYIDQGLYLSTQLHDKRLQARQLSILGSAYLGKNDLTQALSIFIQCAEGFEQVKDTLGLNSALNNIGNVEYKLGHNDKAIAYITRAKTFAKQINDMASYHYGNKVLARIFRKENKLTEASAIYEESIPWYEKTGSRHDLAEVHLSIGNIQFDQKHFDNAIVQYRKANTYASITGNNGMKAYVLFAIGSAYMQLRNNTTAFLYLDSTRMLQPDGYIKMDILELSADMYEREHDYDKAITMIKRRAAMSDSIHDSENRVVLDEMEAKYQSEKKQQEIDSLQAEKVVNELTVRQQRILLFSGIVVVLLLAIAAWYIYKDRKRQEEIRQLQEVHDLNQRIAETRQLALRLQMNPHFIFNCITAIDAFILRDDRKKASEFLNKFARLLRQILENSTHSVISLEKDIECLELYIQLEQMRFNNGFRYTIVRPDDIALDTMLVPPLLFQPHVENAILHGLRHKQGTKELEIAFESILSDTLKVSIRDNGVGRSRSAIINVGGKSHESMGTIITDQRLELMKETSGITATIQISDLFPERDDCGTEVTITLTPNNE